MMFKRVLLLSLAIAACGDDEQSAPYTICDGSDGLRLSLVTAGGGPLPDTAAFTHPYGWRFLHVDGRCNFVASTNVAGQLSHGTFSAQQAAELGDALKLEQTSGVIYRYQGGCADAPGNFVWTPDALIESGCDDAPPARIAPALHWEPAFALAAAAGQPSTGPVSILALREEAPPSAGTAWPFSFPIEQALYTTGVSHEAVPSFAKSLTGADAALARQLWTSASGRGYVAVTEDGASYQLFLRDDLDAAFAAKLRAPTAGIAPCARDRMLAREPSDAGVYGQVLRARVAADAPCGAELCWDGTFDEKSPVGARVALQKPAEARTCLGPRYLDVSADLQPMIDAFRASYPHAPVEIDLGFGTPHDADGDDAICRAVAGDRCAEDARCRPITGTINDATRQCTGPRVTLGCMAKFRGCGAAITGGQAADGRRAVFTDTCIPQGWTPFYGEAADYALPACDPT